MIISILGEALGAFISFILYRRGIKKIQLKTTQHIKYIETIQNTKGIKAFLLILGLRIFPFIPSGIVTLAGAGSKMGMANFSFASTIGKIPALLIEAYSIYQVLNWTNEGKLILTIISVILIGIFFSKKKKSRF